MAVHCLFVASLAHIGWGQMSFVSGSMAASSSAKMAFNINHDDQWSSKPGRRVTGDSDRPLKLTASHLSNTMWHLLQPDWTTLDFSMVNKAATPRLRSPYPRNYASYTKTELVSNSCTHRALKILPSCIEEGEAWAMNWQKFLIILCSSSGNIYGNVNSAEVGGCTLLPHSPIVLWSGWVPL